MEKQDVGLLFDHEKNKNTCMGDCEII